VKIFHTFVKSSPKKQILVKQKLRPFVLLMVVSCFFISKDVYATCTSTRENSSSITTDFGTNANDQCLINSGTITKSTTTSFPLNSRHLNPTITNSGAIVTTGNGSGGIVILGEAGGVASTSGSILNSGTISASGGTNSIYAIWLYNGAGTFDSVVNSGTITLSDTGQKIGIFNYSRNTITTLTNSGSITTSGTAFGVITNNSTISTLNNSGSITSTGSAHGILNTDQTPTASIGTLNNTGTISVTSGSYGIHNNAGSIGTLNNAQGSSSSAGILTYYGVLPSNYNIIVNSASSYGQLAVTSPSGTTTFGINSGSTLVKGTYSSVFTGIASNNLTGSTSGNYNGFMWRLNNSSGSVWDMIVTGASTADTQFSLATQARRLRSAFNSTIVSSNFANMNTYDCNLFDQNNMCISAGGRVTTIDNPSSHHSAAVVVLGHKVSPHIRIGGFLDQSVNHNMPSGVDMSNKNPMMGAFLVWNHQADGLGFQMKLANAYLDKDVTTSRAVVGTSEAGRGRTDLNTQSYVGELSYAFNYQDSTIVRSYFALRHTRIKQDGYTEETSSSVTAPLTYATLSDRSSTALMGVKVNHALTPKTNLTASLGVEQDLDHKVDQLSATGVSGLTSENFNNNIRHTRPVASLGAYYAVAKNQRLSGDIYYQQLPFQSTDSATAYMNYTIGF
jgi:hypothetical protein